MGNPPFVGAKHLGDEQSKDVSTIWGKSAGVGVIDYVSCWYARGAEYSRGTNIETAFVSTNSICQGEQVGQIWGRLFKAGVKINFAHRTFSWESEARGKAHVHVVIIGFAHTDRPLKVITDYEQGGDTGTGVAIVASRINSYLVDGPDVLIVNRSNAVCASPEMGIGNKPIDDGNYLFDRKEHDSFLEEEPAAKKWIKTFYGADDFLYDRPRFCLWLRDCPPSELRRMPAVLRRVEAVKKFRLASKSKPTQKLADTPTRFHVENVPKGRFLLIPRHTSERRSFIPMGYLSKEFLAGDSCLVVADATLYHFGVLCSTIHMAWVRQVCGRLESRYRYSATLVYNNYP